MNNIKRFDMDMLPKKEKWYLTPLAYLLSFPTVWKRKLKVNKVGVDGLKPPYILLCTHHAFIDFKVTTAAIFPYRANYIVAIDGFIKREWLLRNVGAICKRKFTNDLRLFKQIKHGLEKLKYVVAIYPEARYSLCGTTAILPDSLGKMVKVLKHPVVVLNMHGNYLSQPVWNLKERKVNLAADMTQIINKDEIETLSVDAINQRIQKAFLYDEYQWQKDNNIKINFKNRAEGLHKVLYQCPHCMKEHLMDSRLDQLFCHHCGASYTMTPLGELKANQGDTIYSHIPDWYEFQRKEVRKQIENGTYFFEDEVKIESLPNANGYIPIGNGILTHDQNGFHLKSESVNLKKDVLSMYSLHIEYNYFNKGDCLDLSTLDDTYYLYPIHKMNVVTKLHFAVEELYKIQKAQLHKQPFSKE
jgi:transcription elongation factor Elf1